jgi:hypothetical protein
VRQRKFAIQPLPHDARRPGAKPSTTAWPQREPAKKKDRQRVRAREQEREREREKERERERERERKRKREREKARWLCANSRARRIDRQSHQTKHAENSLAQREEKLRVQGGKRRGKQSGRCLFPLPNTTRLFNGSPLVRQLPVDLTKADRVWRHRTAVPSPTLSCFEFF